MAALILANGVDQTALLLSGTVIQIRTAKLNKKQLNYRTKTHSSYRREKATDVGGGLPVENKQRFELVNHELKQSKKRMKNAKLSKPKH